MAPKKRPRAELDALAAGLARPDPTDPPHPDHGRPDRGGTEPHEFDAILRDLEIRLAAAAEDAEHIVASHPLASLAAAFLLGLVIGRAARRS
jgi:hypothetical protein